MQKKRMHMAQIETEMLSGRLVGMGRETGCTVFARRVAIPGTNRLEYRMPSIHNEPEDLPDGQYQLKFADQSIECQRHERAWIFPSLGWSGAA
jgi:hypothetical protein